MDPSESCHKKFLIYNTCSYEKEKNLSFEFYRFKDVNNETY
jgi:hypothetical protein